MNAPKQLRPPSNWQDFESLCSVLFGEVWGCPEIQKNGRLGQVQNGVDIFGIPRGEKAYFGIQCKCKASSAGKKGLHEQFTIQEIEAEIAAAEAFKPALKMLYLVTTAQRDASIQEYVRFKNLDRLNEGLFGVHLFAWEDLVEKIDQYKVVHDFYAKGIHFRTQHSVSVTFTNQQEWIHIEPIFLKRINFFSKFSGEEFSTKDGFHNIYEFAQQFSRRISNSERKNRSLCFVKIAIRNTGITELENYKLIADFHGDFECLIHEDDLPVIDPGLHNIKIQKRNTKVLQRSVQIDGNSHVIVSDDIVTSDEIYLKLKPSLTPSTVTVSWKLLSKTFKDEGKLTIEVKPHLKVMKVHQKADHADEIKVVEGDLEDYIK